MQSKSACAHTVQLDAFIQALEWCRDKIFEHVWNYRTLCPLFEPLPAQALDITVCNIPQVLMALLTSYR